MNLDRVTQILLSPHVTEKATLVGDDSNQYVFKVLKNANKREIKQAVEKMFNVQVATVSVLNVKGKSKRFGQEMGRRKDWKKAYVRLVTGHSIDFLVGE
jgi:large subunit ribosomal protein L23